MSDKSNIPKVGQAAPVFEATTNKGIVRFPTEFQEGQWCILFAHPANFTGAWVMYSTFLALKEKYFTERNCKLLGLCCQPVGPDAEGTWAEKVKRYVGIYLKAPVVEDLEKRVANLYGMVSGRKKQAGFDRVAFIIDPKGIVRGIIGGSFTLQSVVADLEKTLARLQGLAEAETAPPDPRFLQLSQEKADGQPTVPYKSKPAHFPKKEFDFN